MRVLSAVETLKGFILRLNQTGNVPTKTKQAKRLRKAAEFPVFLVWMYSDVCFYSWVYFVLSGPPYLTRGSALQCRTELVQCV